MTTAAVRPRKNVVYIQEQPEERITVRPHVYAPYGSVDQQHMPVQTAPRRTRSRTMHEDVPVITRESLFSPLRKEAPFTRDGVLTKYAVLMAALLVFVLGVNMLISVSQMTEQAKAVDALIETLGSCRETNNTLNQQLANATSDTQVWYKAAQDLGMKSSMGAPVVYLEAPETRPIAEIEQVDAPPARSDIYATLFSFLN